MPQVGAGSKASGRTSLKGLVIFFGTLIGALWTVANVVALYYAKVYLFDRPALSLVMHAAQFEAGEASRQIVVTIEFENSGIRPYRLELKGEKPITLARATVEAGKEVQYEVLQRLSLPSAYTEAGQVVIHDINGMLFSPGEKGRMSTVVPVPGPGLYFVEFNAAAPYQSLLFERLLGKTQTPSWLTANSFVAVK
jgi:hypothetical protein